MQYSTCFMCTIKEKYCIFDEFSGFCGQFVEKLGRKDPLNFCLEEDNITYVKITKNDGELVLFCCKKHDI